MEVRRAGSAKPGILPVAVSKTSSTSGVLIITPETLADNMANFAEVICNELAQERALNTMWFKGPERPSITAVRAAIETIRDEDKQSGATVTERVALAVDAERVVIKMEPKAVKIKNESVKRTNVSAIQKIPPHVSDNNITIFGNNNLNFGINKVDANLVVQFSLIRESQNNIAHQLKLADGKQPSFMAASYHLPIRVGYKEEESEEEQKTEGKQKGKRKIKGKEVKKTEEKKSSSANLYNAFDRNIQVSAHFIEYLPNTLEANVAKLHQENNENNILTMTTHLGIELTNMLNYLDSNNVIWTDLKPGNILLRADNSIVVADTKAFTDVNKIILSKDKNTFKIGYDGNVTDNYLSSQYQRLTNIKFKPEDPPNPSKSASDARAYLKVEWEKEYRYQLAVMLYFVATNEHKLREGKFDFNKPIFTSKDGLILKDMIEKLSDPSPDKRMTMSEATQALQALRTSQLDATVTQSTSVKSLRPSSSERRDRMATMRTRSRINVRPQSDFDTALKRTGSAATVTPASSKKTLADTSDTSDIPKVRK